MIPETYSFTDYSESDANVVSREAVTENDILNDLQTETAAEPESIQEGDDDSGDHAETLLSPVAALTSMRQLDRCKVSLSTGMFVSMYSHNELLTKFFVFYAKLVKLSRK